MTSSTGRLTEIVDWRRGTVRVEGHLTVQGADLLRGTVEAMHRDGHDPVLVDLSGLDAADPDGMAVVHRLARTDGPAADGPPGSWLGCRAATHRDGRR